MERRTQTIAIVAAGFLVVASAGFFAWRNSRVSARPEALLLRLPTQDAVIAGLDFHTLRASGFVDFLLNSKTPQDPDYLAFVRDSGFDYTRDLDYVLASFAPDGEFFLVKGTFDWPRLERYALVRKGSCFDHLCRMEGSTPSRRISYFPLRRNVLALAVAQDDTAASRLANTGPQGDIDVPSQPLWVSLSAGALRHSTSLPGSTKLFASAITDANRVTITVGSAGNPAAGNIEARLDAVCHDAQQAGALTMQMQTLTGMLRNAAQRQGKAVSANDLAGLLASGRFEQAGSHVIGHWPVGRGLLETLAGGT